MTANQTTAPPVIPIPLPPQQLPPLLTRKQTFCDVLQVSMVSGKRWAKSGRFAPLPVKLGRCARYRRDEVLAWVAAGCPARREWRWNGGGK